MWSLGIETPDKESLTECNKKQNQNRYLCESVKSIRRAGLQVQGGLIVGFDSDTHSIIQRQIDLIQKSGIVTDMVGLLKVPPGKRIYKRLKNEGEIPVLEGLFMDAFLPSRVASLDNHFCDI